jgi:threonine/homoserine/homoserine lactone efflux protein
MLLPDPLFIGMTFLAAAAPGPSVLLVSSLSLRSGFWAAVRGTLGIQLGNALFVFVSLAGLLVLLTRSPAIFAWIKLAGALYLIWLGLQLVRSAWQMRRVQPQILDSPQNLPPFMSPKTHFWAPILQGFISQLSNPKGLLYWTALLPQFLPANTTDISHALLVYGLAAAIIDTCVLLGYAMITHYARHALTSRGAQQIIDGTAGCFFVAVGVLLGTSPTS